MTSNKQHKAQSLDAWRLCEELTVSQATMLIIGLNPANAVMVSGTPFNAPSSFEGIYAAIKNAVTRKSIEANVVFATTRQRTLDNEGVEAYETVELNEPDWDKTTVIVASLKVWLHNKNMRKGFFFPEVLDGVPAYLDPNHPCYAPKLAAAIRAWEAISSDPSLLKNKSPKQAIEKWLKDNAAKLNLAGSNGEITSEAIRQITKVCNWKLKGGANKTSD